MEEADQFQCGKCGKPISAKFTKCFHCGSLGPHNAPAAGPTEIDGRPQPAHRWIRLQPTGTNTYHDKPVESNTYGEEMNQEAAKYELTLTKEETAKGATRILPRNGRKLKVLIPAGSKDGTLVRLANALQLTDGTPGDILVTVRVKEDKIVQHDNIPDLILLLGLLTRETKKLAEQQVNYLSTKYGANDLRVNDFTVQIFSHGKWVNIIDNRPLSSPVSDTRIINVVGVGTLYMSNNMKKKVLANSLNVRVEKEKVLGLFSTESVYWKIPDLAYLDSEAATGILKMCRETGQLHLFSIPSIEFY